MGRPAKYLATKVEDFGCVLDLAWLRRTGNCAPGHTGRITWSARGVEKASVGYTVEFGGLRLCYQLGTAGSVASVTEFLPIVTTATQFGGRRQWFSCPGCGRRCRIVYRQERFRCRRCLGAHHASKYQNTAANICARRWRLRSQLEGREGMALPLGLDDGFPPKPPRMHWTTYRRLQSMDQRLERRWNGWVHSKLQRVNPRLKEGDEFLARLESETAPEGHNTNPQSCLARHGTPQAWPYARKAQ